MQDRLGRANIRDAVVVIDVSSLLPGVYFTFVRAYTDKKRVVVERSSEIAVHSSY